MNKYTLIKQKREQAIAKRQTKISRRTFPPSIFQLNSIIAPEVAPPDIITEIEFTEVFINVVNQPYEVEEVIIEPLVEPIQEPIVEPLEIIEPIILLPENQLETENPIIESPI